MSYTDIFAEISTNFSLYPKPFDGQYPTRVHLWSNKRGVFNYMGKPTPEAFQRARREVVLQGLPLNYVEIDQNGCLIVWMSGGTLHNNPFFNATFPIPRIVWECGWQVELYVLMTRKQVKIGNKLIWVMADLFDRKKPWLPYVAMVQDCARGRIKPNWLTDAQDQQLIDLIQPKAAEYFKKPTPGPKPSEPNVLDLGAPPAAQNITGIATNVQTLAWEAPVWATNLVQAAAPPAPVDIDAALARARERQRMQDAINAVRQQNANQRLADIDREFGV